MVEKQMEAPLKEAIVINLAHYKAFKIFQQALQKFDLKLKFKYFKEYAKLADDMQNERITFGVFLDQIRLLK